MLTDGTVQSAARPCPAGGDVAGLTRRLARGEDAAFREFHARYFDRLYRFLLVVARGNEQEAEEALQDTLLRVARYARVLQTEDAFWCWLQVVARNAARDAGRKRTRYASLLDRVTGRWKIWGAEAGPAVGENLSGLLEESLAELEAGERQLLEGKYVQGATVRELAGQTGWTEKAVESRLIRLRRQLRERLLAKLRTP